MGSALRQLLWVRLVGFTREPEALFWTFGFPVLIAVALGIAFRNKGPEKIYVAVVEGAGSAPLHDALVADSALEVSLAQPAEADNQLRTGRVSIVVAQGETP